MKERDTAAYQDLDREGPDRSRSLHLVQPEKGDGEVIATMGITPPSLDCDEVNAVCLSITKIRYGSWGPRLRCVFCVVSPERYQGIHLEMFVKPPRSKTNLRRANKLWKLAKIANPCLRQGQQVTYSLFKGKLFRCKVRMSGTGPTAYPVIDTILEKLTE